MPQKILSIRQSVRLSRHTFPNLISLTGITGLHPNLKLKYLKPECRHKKLPYILSYNNTTKSPEGGVVTLEFETTLVKLLKVDIEFLERSLFLEEIHSTGAQEGVVALWLAKSIEEAKRLGYTHIRLNAYGDKNETEMFGYKIWARYGFIMAKCHERRFASILKEFGRSESDIHDLQSSPEGNKIWVENGFSWIGIFDLADNSLSMKRFGDYLKKQNEKQKEK